MRMIYGMNNSVGANDILDGYIFAKETRCRLNLATFSSIEITKLTALKREKHMIRRKKLSKSIRSYVLRLVQQQLLTRI